MDLLIYSSGGDQAEWTAAIGRALPEARIRGWRDGDEAPADYALVWKPPPELFESRAGLKAVFNLGAGVDAVLNLLARHPHLLATDVPLIRLEDAGMARQMVHYVLYGVLGHFRRMDDYARQQSSSTWQILPPRLLNDYPIGVMGAGVLGAEVATGLASQGFDVRTWSRSPRIIADAVSHHGPAGLQPFADGLQVLVNLLPHTPETAGILNTPLFARLAKGACLINVARGAHVVDADLLAALDGGQLDSAMLDVFHDEPLPVSHPFWRHPRVRLTPHVSAVTLIEQSVAQIADKIRQLELGLPVSGIVDRQRGY